MATETKKVLVVDDDPDFVEVIRTILEQEGYRVVMAANGTEALEKARAEAPDLMLLDVMMSHVLEGVEVTHLLEEDPLLRHIPVLMISSIADTSSAAFFPMDESLAIDGWISKPVSPSDLLQKVARALA